MKQNIARYRSPIGDIDCAFEGQFLVGVTICGSPEKMTTHPALSCSPERERFEAESTTLPPKVRSRFGKELDAYFRGDLRVFTQPISFVAGTAFERQVWNALRGIPYGVVRSYRWLAERIGRPRAARAVGQALSKNPLPLIVPCHRIIASDGTLGGFSSGLGVKQWLLRHEAYAVASPVRPPRPGRTDVVKSLSRAAPVDPDDTLADFIPPIAFSCKKG
ncbi:MAG: methylated-DNA--[protein]-cysteine S-methyltransferase [Deltaproteobacteria bacterium]